MTAAWRIEKGDLLLSCIYLDQPLLKGFREFISSWLVTGRSSAFIVDPGPLSTIPVLVRELEKKNVSHLDYILLTHIHIDHAGGTGELLKQYPDARVICHPKGIPHLIDPEKLWKGSLKILGKTAEAYREIISVPEKNICFRDSVYDGKLTVHRTPGHASHHLCFLMDGILFGGEVCGVYCRFEDGCYMRPATPPRFDYEIAKSSIDQMIELNPDSLIVGHHGLAEPAGKYLKAGRDQLKIWMKAIAQTRNVDKAELNGRLYEWLVENDRLFSGIQQLAPDIQERERHFMGNSIAGMRQYFETLSPEQQTKWIIK